MPAVKDMLATAQKILGYDLLKLCLEGPEDQLEQTKFCQPAAGLVYLRVGIIACLILRPHGWGIRGVGRVCLFRLDILRLKVGLFLIGVHSFMSV